MRRLEQVNTPKITTDVKVDRFIMMNDAKNFYLKQPVNQKMRGEAMMSGSA